jgi:FixJ family two-component response regulator
MDVRLPGMSGAEATAAILRSFPDARVLMLSTHSGEEEIYRAMQAGARGYILKSVLREDLLRAIRDVHAGKRHMDPIVASHLAERVSHKSLTSRELEVLRMVAKGWGNKEIASALQCGNHRKAARKPRSREAQREGPHGGGNGGRATRDHLARLSETNPPIRVPRGALDLTQIW